MFDWLFGKKKGEKPAKSEEGSAVSEVLRSLMKNEIAISAEAGKCAPGESRIGGKPFVPADFRWPCRESDGEDGKPLSFLCQIDLAETHRLDKDGLLPERGLLSFFYDVEEMPWGFDPADKGCARVYFFENTDGFVLADYPDELDAEYCADEMKLTFKAGVSCPSFEELDLYTDLDGDFDDYDDLLEELGVDTELERHKLLGYADLIQNECLTQCEMCCRRIFNGDPKNRQSLTDEGRADINRAAKDWILLFQMASIDAEGCPFMWGDLGNLYFFIRKDDLAARNFDKVWLVLQCY